VGILEAQAYVVLRFLAEDIGKNLDDVLDAILRTLASRQRDKKI
jgi:very-short-patch-repair endonuclease